MKKLRYWVLLFPMLAIIVTTYGVRSASENDVLLVALLGLIVVIYLTNWTTNYIRRK
jgi:putative effector of murein hydrolase LrgA (UPF0299 family)